MQPLFIKDGASGSSPEPLEPPHAPPLQASPEPPDPSKSSKFRPLALIKALLVISASWFSGLRKWIGSAAQDSSGPPETQSSAILAESHKIVNPALNILLTLLWLWCLVSSGFLSYLSVLAVFPSDDVAEVSLGALTFNVPLILAVFFSGIICGMGMIADNLKRNSFAGRGNRSRAGILCAGFALVTLSAVLAVVRQYYIDDGSFAPGDVLTYTVMFMVTFLMETGLLILSGTINDFLVPLGNRLFHSLEVKWPVVRFLLRCLFGSIAFVVLAAIFLALFITDLVLSLPVVLWTWLCALVAWIKEGFRKLSAWINQHRLDHTANREKLYQARAKAIIAKAEERRAAFADKTKRIADQERHKTEAFFIKKTEKERRKSDPAATTPYKEDIES